MSNLLIKGGKLVIKDGKLVLSSGDCLSQCCGQCCGVPKNCEVTVYIGDSYVFNHATGAWEDASSNQIGITFGDCQYMQGGVPSGIPDLGSEYQTCCISITISGTPAAANPSDPCLLLTAAIAGRVVCDSCCDAEPEYEGDQNDRGVNCRIEGVVTDFTQMGDCSAYRTSLDFDNWSITITCDPTDGCNEFP